MPSMLEAHKLSSRAAQVGFDWPNVEGLFEKLAEETAELRTELRDYPAPGPRPEGVDVTGSEKTRVSEELRSRLEEEVGDLFFVLVNLARYLSLDSESALRKGESQIPPALPVRGNTTPRKRRVYGERFQRRVRSSLAVGEAAGETGVSAHAIEIRHCQGLEELRACVALQKEIWNFSDSELVPLRMFVVAEKVGGQVMGAFEGKEMVGFALSVPGTRSGHLYLHSHMLAVRKDYRNGGLGRRLKLLQREDALARGIELIEWTFDPLEIKNTYLNIEKLGAVARRYNINKYGITTSPLQGGLPSDRLIAEWWLKSKRVETLLSTGQLTAFARVLEIEVPAHIYEWKASAETRIRAQQVQVRNREQFLNAFDRDLAVLGYERDAEGQWQVLAGELA